MHFTQVLDIIGNFGSAIKLYNDALDSENLLSNMSAIAEIIELEGDDAISNIGYKVNRSTDDKVMYDFIRSLHDLPKIDNNQEIIYDDSFIYLFYSIIWPLLRNMAVATENFYEFSTDIVRKLNNITSKDYIIEDCRSLDKYNCARAMIVINIDKSRFLLFNSDAMGNMSENVISAYAKYQTNNNTLESIISQSLAEIKSLLNRNKDLLSRPNITNRLYKEIAKISDKGYNCRIDILPNNVYPFIITCWYNDNEFRFQIPTDYPAASVLAVYNGYDITDSYGPGLNWQQSYNLPKIIDNVSLNLQGLAKLPFV